MDYVSFINSTLSRDSFQIINSNANGTCCYDSILRLLKLDKKVKPNMNTKIIQAKAVNWIIKNKDLYLHNFDLSIENYILYTHQFDSFSDYIENYKIYSGKFTDKTTHDRWGGIPELIALSYIYEININIYTGKSFDKHRNKIIKGTILNGKPRKDFRYKLLLNTARNEFDKTYNILYTQYDKSSHFDALLELNK